ncbi:RNA-binding protein 33-like [Culex pipiens pallens]|uniref:RNA-binding protein 33-like n=1 Tax=Culex pipiens pallens TaxID=42434 RepID=UPI0019532C06|nr:RNA-binding protein 33-like [Culex pipiens pallens]
MQQIQPCKIGLKWPACCPRCLLDLRVSPEDSPTVNLTEPVPAATMILEEVQQVTTQEQFSSAEEQANPATLQLMGPFELAANGKAKFVTSCAVDGPPEEIVLLWPPLPEEELKQETPPPPPPASEPNVVGSNQAPTVTMIPVQGQSMPQQRMDQYYGLLPTPTQVTFAAQAQQPVPNPSIQYGQLTLNPPPPIIVSHQQAQPQPAWSSQPSPQQPFYQTATWYRQPPPPQAVLVQQQQQPAPQQRYVQFQTPPPVNFPFPPPTLQLQPGQAPTMVPANGVFTVQHHFLNVLPPGQFQQ